MIPTSMPTTSVPTEAPLARASFPPTIAPTLAPSLSPTPHPTLGPTGAPAPTVSQAPTQSLAPTSSESPSIVPTFLPTLLPSSAPSSVAPSVSPSTSTAGPFTQSYDTPSTGFAITFYQRARENGFSDPNDILNPWLVETYYTINGFTYLRAFARGLPQGDELDLSDLMINISGIPPGMVYNPSDGRIYGSPTRVGSYFITLNAQPRDQSVASAAGLQLLESARIEDIIVEVTLPLNVPECQVDNDCDSFPNTFSYEWGQDQYAQLSSTSYRRWRESVPSSFGNNPCDAWGEYFYSYNGYTYYTYTRFGGICPSIRRSNCQIRCCNIEKVPLELKPGFVTRAVYKTTGTYGTNINSIPVWPGNSDNWFSPCEWCGGPETDHGCIRCIQGWGKDENGKCIPCYNKPMMTIDNDGFCVPCGCPQGTYISSGCRGDGRFYDETAEMSYTSTQEGRRITGSPMMCSLCKLGCNGAAEINSYFTERCESTGFLNNFCTPCSTCFSNNFRIRGCEASNSTRSDIECRSCLTCDFSNQYESAPCTPTSDRLCINATDPCDLETEYEIAPKTLTSDRICTPYVRSPCLSIEWESAARSPTSDRYCSPCTICSEVDSLQFEAVECSPTSDAICAQTTPCPAGTYEYSAPTATTDRDCEQITTCEAGYYARNPGNNLSNTECAQCGTCNSGEYILQECNTTSNTVCETCSSTCPPRTIRTGACVPEATANFICEPCANLTCSPGFRRVGQCGLTISGIYLNNFSCVPCSSQDLCTTDEYLTGNCGGDSPENDPTADYSCQICGNIDCPEFTQRLEGSCTNESQSFSCEPCPTSCQSDEFYVENSTIHPTTCECRSCRNACDHRPGYFSNHPTNCQFVPEPIRCTKCQVCAAGSFLSSGCTATEDTVCSPCSERCEPNQFITNLNNCSAEAMESFATVCIQCSTCPLGKFLVLDCTDDADVTCDDCITNCSFGEYLENTCDAFTTPDTQPICRPCPTGRYYSGAISGGLDVQCPLCEDPNDCTASGFFFNGSCTNTSSGICTPCNVCTPGSYVRVACGGNQDVQCEACADGTFTSTINANVCTPHTVTHCPNDDFYVYPSLVSDGRCNITTSPSFSPTSLPSQAPSGSGCQAGQYVEVVNGISGLSCVSCEHGTYQSENEFLGNSCMPWQRCGAGFYAVNGTSIRDITCVECEEEFFQPLTSAFITPEACTPISLPCTVGTYEALTPTKTSDRECRACTRCDLDHEFEAHACSGSDDTQCQLQSQCSLAVGTYESSPATATSDTVCSNISMCNLTQYEIEVPTATTDRLCKNCTACDPNRIQVRECGNQSDTVCSARCGPGWYGGTNGACSRCTLGNRDSSCGAGGFCPRAVDIVLVADGSAAISTSSHGGNSSNSDIMFRSMTNLVTEITQSGSDLIRMSILMSGSTESMSHTEFMNSTNRTSILAAVDDLIRYTPAVSWTAADTLLLLQRYVESRLNSSPVVVIQFLEGSVEVDSILHNVAGNFEASLGSQVHRYIIRVNGNVDTTGVTSNYLAGDDGIVYNADSWTYLDSYQTMAREITEVAVLSSCSWDEYMKSPCSSMGDLSCIFLTSTLTTTVTTTATFTQTTSATTTPTTTTISSATTIQETTPDPCPRVCGASTIDSIACDRNGNCLSCDSDKILIHGTCISAISCIRRKIEYGRLMNQSCRCSNSHCHKCYRTADGEICRRCRDGWYLRDGDCYEDCPANQTLSGVSLWGRRCLDPFTCKSNRILELDVNFGCKCPNQDCHTCLYVAQERGDRCVNCRNSKFLFNNTCLDSCDGLDGMISYIPAGSYGRQCRPSFSCVDGVDQQGLACRCPKALRNQGCPHCVYRADDTVGCLDS